LRNRVALSIHAAASMLASSLHKGTVNAKPPYTVTGIIIHKLAAALFKPRGSKRGEKVAAYSPEITVGPLLGIPLCHTSRPLERGLFFPRQKVFSFFKHCIMNEMLLNN